MARMARVNRDVFDEFFASDAGPATDGETAERGPSFASSPGMIRWPQFTLALVLIVPVAACGTKIDHVKRGQEFASQKKFKEAVIEYRAALEQDDRNGIVRLALGDVYAAAGEGPNAFHEYVRASDLLPTNIDAQLKAGSVLLMAKQYKEAAARADRALRVEPRNANALTLVGNALIGLGNIVGAERRLNDAIDADPESALAYSSLGALKLAQGDTVQAEALFQTAVSSNPKSVVARIALAQFFDSQRRSAEAEATLKDAATLDPHDLRVNAQLSQLYVRTGRETDAEDAVKALAGGLNTIDSQFMLADYYLRTNRAVRAVPLLEKLAGNADTAASAQVRLAAISYTQGRAPEAEKKVTEVLRQHPKHRDALLLKARMLLKAKNYDAALPVLKAAADADQAHAVEPIMLQANVYLSRGQLGEARDIYKEALRLAPQSTEAQLALSKLYAATGENKDAMDLALSAVRQDPFNPDAHLNLEQRMFAQGDLEGATRQIRLLQDKFGPSAPVQIEAAALYAARKDFKSARAALERALAISPDSLNALEGLVALDLAGQDRAAARARVEARLKQAPREGQTWFLAAQLYGVVGELARQEEALKKTIELTPSNFRAYTMLGRLYGFQGRIADARRQFEAWSAREPRSVAAKTMVGLLLEQERNLPAAQKVYEETIEIDPRAAVAANNLAWMYAERGDRGDDARRLAELAVAQAPEIADFTDTLGWVYYKADLTSSAVPQFEKAVQRDPDNPLYHYHLGLARLKQHDDVEARDALKKALALNPSFPGAADARTALSSLD
jgi:tetratricopeptide (TPR) repeat protein